MKFFTKSEFVYNRLLEMIYAGELKPGQTFTAVEIAGLLEVSRTPVNEAVKRLSDKKLLTILPNVGFQLTALSSDEIIDLYELKIVIEVTAIRWIEEREIRLDIGRLKNLNQSIRSALKKGNRKKYNQAVREFHMEFMDSVKSQPLLDSFMGTWDYSGWEDTMFMDMTPDLVPRCDEHDLILHHLEKGEFEKARNIVGVHGRQLIELFKKHIPTGEKNAV